MTPDPATRLARYRRNAVVVALVAAALASLVQGIATSTIDVPEGPADRLAATREHADQYRIVGPAFLVAQLGLLVGALGLLRLAPSGRGAGLAHAGASIAVVGTFAHAVVGGAMLVTLLMADASRDAEQMATLMADMMRSPMIMPWFALGLGGFVIGFVLLPIGLARARAVPVWTAACFLVGLVGEFVLPTVLPASVAATSALVAAGLLGFAVTLARAPPVVPSVAVPERPASPV